MKKKIETYKQKMGQTETNSYDNAAPNSTRGRMRLAIQAKLAKYADGTKDKSETRQRMKKAFRQKLEKLQLEMGPMNTTSEIDTADNVRLTQSERMRKAMLHKLQKYVK